MRPQWTYSCYSIMLYKYIKSPKIEILMKNPNQQIYIRKCGPAGTTESVSREAHK